MSFFQSRSRNIVIDNFGKIGMSTNPKKNIRWKYLSYGSSFINECLTLEMR